MSAKKQFSRAAVFKAMRTGTKSHTQTVSAGWVTLVAELLSLTGRHMTYIMQPASTVISQTQAKCCCSISLTLFANHHLYACCSSQQQQQQPLRHLTVVRITTGPQCSFVQTQMLL